MYINACTVTIPDNLRVHRISGECENEWRQTAVCEVTNPTATNPPTRRAPYVDAMSDMVKLNRSSRERKKDVENGEEETSRPSTCSQLRL